MTHKRTITALMALIVFLGVMAFKNKKSNIPVMVTVNMPEIIQKHSQRLAQNNTLGEAERKRKAKTLAQDLQLLLQRTAKDNQLIILSKGAVVAGIKDITGAIDQRLGANDGY